MKNNFASLRYWYIYKICQYRILHLKYNQAGIYLFKINSGNTSTILEIYTKSNNKSNRTTLFDVILVSLLFTLNTFHTLFSCFHSWLWTNKCVLGKRRAVVVDQRCSIENLFKKLEKFTEIHQRSSYSFCKVEWEAHATLSK